MTPSCPPSANCDIRLEQSFSWPAVMINGPIWVALIEKAADKITLQQGELVASPCSAAMKKPRTGSLWFTQRVQCECDLDWISHCQSYESMFSKAQTARVGGRSRQRGRIALQ